MGFFHQISSCQDGSDLNSNMAGGCINIVSLTDLAHFFGHLDGVSLPSPLLSLNSFLARVAMLGSSAVAMRRMVLLCDGLRPYTAILFQLH